MLDFKPTTLQKSVLDSILGGYKHGKVMTIMGGSGTGKTLFAKQMMEEFNRKRMPRVEGVLC